MSRETEIVVFARVGDFNGMKEATSVVAIDQLERFIPGKGRMRTRKTVSNEGTVFEVGVKTIGTQEGVALKRDEEESPVTGGFFECFRNVAETLTVKNRYIFDGTHSVIELESGDTKLPPVKFEVDVYKKHDGSVSPWVKIDIEIDEFNKAVQTIPELKNKDLVFNIKVTHLPFKPQEAFIVGAATDEQKQLMAKLWQTEFNQSPFGGPYKPVEASVDSSTNTPPPQQPEVNQTPEAENERTNEN